MAEDIYKRYDDLTRRGQDRPKTTRIQDRAAAVLGKINTKNGRGIMGLFGDNDNPLGEAMAWAKEKHEAARLKAKIAISEAQLSRANPQLIANAQSVNQRAAIEGQVQATRSAEGTADLASGQDGDTETPGGTSGRRRRTSAAVGSIRI